ncbi:D-alanyl-D-alanine carboxypeptidase family protein [Ohessyouella blattaphilus]|uniref:Serine hydrolase n=1 Tax=Ohessyouella blattaphilus TaxID=2949333 RepID=A0ABT1EET6_9FIRM|nr:serine hydrolase [Ohessyouella blattaphilus]MCP1109215.1 serine hydrolase [Ohessyouella blattaphilus]MCR8562609.1 serine hydrolase [Ohessyouella blattaphilus]
MKSINKVYVFCIALILLLSGCQKEESISTSEVIHAYEQATFTKAQLTYEFKYSPGLCVAPTDVNLTGVNPVSPLSGSALFDLDGETVLYGQNLFQMVYPASITKIMTALVAIENGNLDEMVTITPEALDIPSYSSVCNLQVGDVISLRDLLSGMLISSGNDAANAIALHVGGTIENFIQMMNDKAASLMATSTHYVNAHGLHDPNHYTTPYDLYLIFNACLASPDFCQIIEQRSYKPTIENVNSGSREEEWESTIYYLNGNVEEPQGVHILGGKTGTTDEAGNCLLVYGTVEDKPYICLVLGAGDKSLVYENMNGMFATVPRG